MSSSSASCVHCLLLPCLLLLSSSSWYLQILAEGDANVVVIKVEDIKHLLPSGNCSIKHGSYNDNKNTLSMWYTYGPCSPFGGKTTRLLTLEEMIENDKSRVAFLSRKRTSKNITTLEQDLLRSALSTVPAHHGRKWGFIGFVVTVGLGSPQIQQTMCVDTGSDLTWVHCNPCGNSCHKQNELLFDPSTSKTYSWVSCHDSWCTAINVTGLSFCTGDQSDNLCEYVIGYADKSYTRGILSKDTLTLTPSDVFQNFEFGCSQHQSGFDTDVSAGLIGLSRGPHSFIQQTASKLGKAFSYCLPSSPSSQGHLTIGASLNTTNVSYTPMLSKPDYPLFYFLELVGISIGGKPLGIPSTEYAATDMIIDSGSSISRLPLTIYTKLQSTFRSKMANYKQVVTVSGPPHTCYDFTGLTEIDLPSMSFHFRGASMAFQDMNQLLFYNTSRRTFGCLAFTPMGPNEPFAILGYIQQRNFEVVYDLESNRVGFGTGTCGG